MNDTQTNRTQSQSESRNGLPLRSGRHLRPAALGLLAALAGLAASPTGAQTFSFSGTLLSSDNSAPPVEPLITVVIPGMGPVPFYAWKKVDNGVGQVTAQAGWTSLAGVPAADLTFDFGDLELLNLAVGGVTSTETYGEADGSPRFFNLYDQGVKIATGGDFSLDIVTDTNPGSPNYTLATGTGWVTLAPVGGHSFVTELAALQGGSSVLQMNLSSFVAPVLVFPPRSEFNSSVYNITGSGAASVVPEPSTYALVAALGLGGFAFLRHRKQNG